MSTPVFRGDYQVADARQVSISPGYTALPPPSAIKSWVLAGMTIATFVAEKAGVRNPRLAGYSLGS